MCLKIQQNKRRLHLMLLWFPEPSLCWQCSPRCRDSPTHGGADVRSSPAGKQEMRLVKTKSGWNVWSYQYLTANYCVVNYEKHLLRVIKWFIFFNKNHEQNPFVSEISFLSIVSLLVHNTPCFPGDQMQEPVEGASLSLCCRWCKFSLGFRQLYLTGTLL